MKSRITIEVDFENDNQPVLQILNCPSFDVRDKLLSHFLQSLAHTSRWLTIHFVDEFLTGTDGEKGNKWIIRPVTPKQLPEEIDLMNATLRANEPTSGR